MGVGILHLQERKICQASFGSSSIVHRFVMLSAKFLRMHFQICAFLWRRCFRALLAWLSTCIMWMVRVAWLAFLIAGAQDLPGIPRELEHCQSNLFATGEM